MTQHRGARTLWRTLSPQHHQAGGELLKQYNGKGKRTDLPEPGASGDTKLLTQREAAEKAGMSKRQQRPAGARPVNTCYDESATGPSCQCRPGRLSSTRRKDRDHDRHQQ